MKTEDYLITLKQGPKTRRFVWHSHDPMPIENRHWYLKRNQLGGVQVIHKSVVHQLDPGSQPLNIRVDPDILISGDSIEIPSDPLEPRSGLVQLSIRLLSPLRAAYLPVQSTSLNDAGRRGLPSPSLTQVIYLFEGIRYYLKEYSRIQGSYTSIVDGIKIFVITQTPSGFQIRPFRESVCFRCSGERKKVLKAGEVAIIPDAKFFQGSLQYGKHWWRVSGMPLPHQIPQDDPFDQGSAGQKADKTWLNRISSAVVLSIFSLSVFVHYWPHREPIHAKPVRVDLSKLPLKQPKIIAKKPEAIKPKPKPKPIPVPVVPKSVPKPKPKLPKVPPKRAPKAPAKKPISRQKAPTPVKRPVTHPVTRAVPRPVTRSVPRPVVPQVSSQVVQRARVQADLAKSLSFLSPSKNRMAAPQAPLDHSTGKYSGSALAVPSNSKSLVLGKITSSNEFDGAISTRGSRSMRGGEVVSGRSKGLNEVQGRLSLASIGSGGAGGGSDLGASLSSQGLAMSGSGQISEAAVERVLSKYQAKLQYCYEKALLSDSSLAGTILMQWVISTSGSVSDVQVVRSQMNHAGLNQCISNILAGIHFPSPKGGAVILKFPFAFSSSSL